MAECRRIQLTSRFGGEISPERVSRQGDFTSVHGTENCRADRSKQGKGQRVGKKKNRFAFTDTVTHPSEGTSFGVDSLTKGNREFSQNIAAWWRRCFDLGVYNGWLSLVSGTTKSNIFPWTAGSRMFNFQPDSSGVNANLLSKIVTKGTEAIYGLKMMIR